MESWDKLSEQHNGEFIPDDLWNQGALSIKYKQWEFILDVYKTGLGRKTTKHTRIRVPVLTKSGLKFTIYRSNILSGIGKLLKMQDIKIGDDQFNKEFIIKGNQEKKIKALLEDESLREIIYDNLVGTIGVYNYKNVLTKEQFPEGIEVLYFETTGEIEDKEVLNNLLSILSATLNRLASIGVISADKTNFRPRKTFKQSTIYLMIIVVAGLSTFITNLNLGQEKETVDQPVEEQYIPEESNTEYATPEEVYNTKEIDTITVIETQIDKVVIKVNEDFTMSSIVPAGASIVFNKTPLYSTSALESSTSSINAGDTIMIIGSSKLYIIHEHGDLQLTGFTYEIEHNNLTSFIKGTDLIMNQIIVKGTQLTIGIDSKDGGLKLKAFQNNALMYELGLMDRAYKTNIYETGYDVYKFNCQLIDNYDFKDIRFIRFTDENNGSDGWLQTRTYYWNGRSLKQITLDNDLDNILESEFVFPSDPTGINDTLTCNVLTGTLDESGEYTEEEKHTFFFINDNGEIKEVVKR